MEERGEVNSRSLDVSIISLTWNSEKHLKKFLDSVLEDLRESGLSYEVIIIDNASKDSTLKILEEYRNREPNFIYIPLGRNTGTTFSRNIGIRMARGKYIGILDSDTIVPKGTIRKIIDAFQEIPSDKIGIIHPRLVYPDGTFQESARRFPTLWIKVARLMGWERIRKKLESIEEVLSEKITTVDYAISAAWFLKRSVFDEVGLLDEKIFYAPEDAEFCARIWKNGMEVWYYPKVEIIHDAQRITKRRPLSKLGIVHILGLLRFWIKHHKTLKRCKV